MLQTPPGPTCGRFVVICNHVHIITNVCFLAEKNP